MVVGDDQHHRVVEQFGDPQIVVGDPVPGEVPEQRECDRAFFQKPDQCVPPGAADSELDGRVALFEGADGDREEGTGHGGEGAEIELTPPEAGDLVQV